MYFLKHLKLISTTLWAFSAYDILMIFFSQKIDFDISCKLIPYHGHCHLIHIFNVPITRTSLFKYTENFTTKTMEVFR